MRQGNNKREGGASWLFSWRIYSVLFLWYWQLFRLKAVFCRLAFALNYIKDKESMSKIELNNPSGVPLNSRFWYEMGLVFSAVVWGLNVGVTKSALMVMHPFVFNALRFTLSTSLFGILFFSNFFGNAQAEMKAWKHHLKGIFLVAFFGHILYQFCFVLSVRYTSTSNVALLVASSPLWTALVGRFLGTEYLKRIVWIGLFVSFIGTLLILLTTHQKFEWLGMAFIGNVLALGAAFSWGAHNALSKPLLNTFSPLGLMFVTMLISAPVHWISAAPSIWAQGISFPSWAVAGVLYSGLISTGVGYIFWNTGVQRLGAAQTAVFSNLVPLVALVVSVWYFRESLYIQQLLGGCFIFGGLFLTRQTKLGMNR
jgi:drug/metabolite transporter (DMT)-like permease